jgi:hypothetical protein
MMSLIKQRGGGKKPIKKRGGQQSPHLFFVGINIFYEILML